MFTRKFNRQNLLPAIGLTIILALGAFLRFYYLGAYSIGNTYYAATVKSMLTSAHNFFYAAFEPGGSVTVDKPPLGFWVQAVFAYFLGVNGFALALPQALAGVLSIAVLYHLVRRHFGVKAGLAAALTLAVVPVTVATERNNTIDGQLVFVLLLAAWAFLKAAESGKTRHLFLGAFLVGVGFNIKMLQAFMPLPAFYLVYLLSARRTWWQRILQLGAATAVLFVVSFAWVAAVDLTPAEDRPYVGSSENNTVTELIIGHNGLRRLGLADGGPGRGDGGQPAAALGGQPPRGDLPGRPPDGFPSPRLNPAPQGKLLAPPPEALAACNGLSPGDACTVVRPPGDEVNGACFSAHQDQLICVPENRQPLPGRTSQNVPGGTPPAVGGAPGGVGPGRSSEIGTAGALRLLQQPLVTEASWVLVWVLLGMPLAIVTLGWAWPLQDRQRSLLLWAGWLLPSLAYFSFTTGLFHRYYLIMLGPPLAALSAIILWSLARQAARRPALGWLLAAFLGGMNLLFEIYVFRSYSDYAGWVTVISLLLWLMGLGVLAAMKWHRSLQSVGLALVLIAILVAPFTWALLTTLNPSPNVALPTAGVAEADITRSTFMTPDQEVLTPYEQAVLEYTLEHTDPDSYLLATNNARGAAPFILATGRPVLTFGGFSGGDDVVNLNELQAMIARGELRFILGLPQKQEIARWIAASCEVVPGLEAPSSSRNRPPAPGGLRGGPQNEVLYDCGG